MKDGVLYIGKTNQSEEYIIRYPKPGDAPAMLAYINTISQEQTFIRFQGEQLTLKEEEAVLTKQLEKIAKQEGVMLLVVIYDKIIGISSIDMYDKASKHEGNFGISILKEYRGQGIGKKLMQLVLDEGQKHIPQLRLATLGIFGNNSVAMDMYKKFGFVEHGRLPQGILHKGVYIDHIYMHKRI